MPRRLIIVGAVATALAGCAEPLPLSETSQAAIVSPLSIDFGASPVGVETAGRGVAVSYGPGYGYDTVLAVSTCPDFRVELSPLPAEIYKICEGGGGIPNIICDGFVDTQGYYLTVYFRPSVANVESCNLVIDLQSGLDKTVALTGTGTAPPVDITLVQPGSPAVDFGDVLVGQASSPRTITVRSDGGMSLAISGAAPSGAGFNLTGGTAPVSLAPNATADYTVSCTPPGPGVTTGNFRITSNDPDEANFDISLRCNGIQSALAIDPSPATLPTARIGETTEIPITLANSGTAPLVIDSVTIDGAGLAISAPPATTNLGPGASTPITVAFTPTDDGDVAGTLTVTFDGGQTRQIAVTGPGRVATLSVTPSGQVDLGPICVGQNASQLFVALDTGTGGFTVNTVSLAGSGFTLTPVNPASYPAPVAPLGGGTVTFQVGVAPVAAGDLTGTISIETDIPVTPAQTIDLHAVGLAGGTTATPAELDTGAAVVGEGAGARLVALSNCEAEPLTIVSVGLEGANAAEFAIVTAPVSTEIAPATSAGWLVELRPTTPGEKTANFHIVHSRGTADVPLVGDGLGHSGSGDPRGSYYACAATGGEPAGLLVIVGAIGLAVRRRRAKAP